LHAADRENAAPRRVRTLILAIGHSSIEGDRHDTKLTFPRKFQGTSLRPELDECRAVADRQGAPRRAGAKVIAGGTAELIPAGIVTDGRLSNQS